MRIALVAPLVSPIREPQLGGSQAVVADLAQGLTARGHDVEVYAASGSSIPGVRTVDTGIRSEALAGTLFRADRTAATVDEARELAFRTVFGAVGRGRYDLVHNHAFDPPAVRQGAGLPFPVVHTLHLPPDQEMAAALEQAAGEANPPAVAAVSESSAAGWRRLARIDVVLRNGVPIDQIPWSKTGVCELLFAGRFSPEKGAADAIAIARRAGVPINLYGEPYDPDYAHDRVYPHRGEQGITIHAGVSRPEIWRVMARSYALLFPALWEEPFGMVAAEAQAAGTPVIAYESGALAEVILRDRTGFLLPQGDREGAARAIARLAGISRVECRRHAEAHLGLDATIAAHEVLYRRLLSTGRGATISPGDR